MSGIKKSAHQLDVESTEIDAGRQALKDLQSIPTPIMKIDRDYSVTFINDAGARVMGSTPEALIGKKCFDLCKTTHCNTMECRCRQTMESGEVRTGETVARPNGGEVPIRYTASPVFDDDGNIAGALEYIIDISEQSAILEEVQAKVSLLDSIPTPIVAIDRDYSVTYLNPAAAGVLGQSQEALLGRKCFDLFRAGHCNTNECRCRQAMDTRSARSGETEIHVGGQTIPIEYTGAPLLDHDGNVVGALEYVLNITERKAVLEDIVGVAKSLAQSDLTKKAEGQYEGDYLAIVENLNSGISAQHDVIVQVAEAVDQVAAASEQISGSSQAVATGASEQASSLEETSSSLEQMASMTRQNADNAQAANGLARTAQEAADTGGAAMNRMLEAMTQIKASAESTADIIRDINEIAFQTNLLALNAAVEAARAGDAGRGFAVVAEEVRNLAGRAKDAARNTEELIKQSVTLAAGGETISHEVESNLGNIVDSVSKVSGIVGEIAVASDEQSRGIDSLNAAMSDIDKVTQQNAANAQEGSSAAEELNAQALELASLISTFHLERQARVRRSRGIPPRIRASRAVQQPSAPIGALHGGNGVSKSRSLPARAESLIPFNDTDDFADF